MTFDTPEGRAMIDTTLCRLGDAKPGDVLVVRYGEYATRSQANDFVDALNHAVRALRKAGMAVVGVPVVVAPDDLSWEFAAAGRVKTEQENG